MGTAFQKSFPARGFVVGDNDEAIGVIVCNNGGRPVLLKNNAAKWNSWLGLKLEGVTCNRYAIGAKIYWTAEGKRRYRLKNNGGSYLSSHDPVKFSASAKPTNSRRSRSTGPVPAPISRN